MKVPPIALYLLAAAVAAAPAWIVAHPPLTDLPYHLATIRIFHSLHDPRYGMEDFYVLSFTRTQYILYYGLGHLLAYVVGVFRANTLLVTAYLSGTVLAMRSLLIALGRDPRACLFVVPLLYGRLFLLGLLPFLLGIPLMFWGIALAVRSFREPTLARGLAVGTVAVLLFFTHIAPFALFVLACGLLFPWRAPGRLRRAAPVLPAVLLGGAWLELTDAGRITQGAMDPTSADVRPLALSLQDLPNWLLHTFYDGSDKRITLAAAAVALVSILLGLRERTKGGPSLARTYAGLPLVCAVAYFALPDGVDFVWPLSQRFVLLAALTAVPLVPMPSGDAGKAVTAALAFVGFLTVRNVCSHFIDFERNEVGDFEQVLAHIPPGQKVCALIFQLGSAYVENPPFLHFGSYYQAEKGGLVMFSFAGYPHWPVDYQSGRGPPSRPDDAPRWEWVPQSMPVETEIYPYYDYVLVRGSDDFHPPPNTYGLTWSDGPWHVWKRMD